MNATDRDLINGWPHDCARSGPVYRMEQEILDRLGSRRVAVTLIPNGRVVVKLDNSSLSSSGQVRFRSDRTA